MLVQLPRYLENIRNTFFSVPFYSAMNMIIITTPITDFIKINKKAKRIYIGSNISKYLLDK